MSLLFSRLPPPLKDQALRRVQRFVGGTCLPSVIKEVNILMAACLLASPQGAVRGIGLPTLQQLQQDLTSMPQPSKVC